MRITVGGLLMLGLGGTVGYLASGATSVDWVSVKVKEATQGVSSLFGLIQSADQEKTVQLQPTLFSDKPVETVPPLVVETPLSFEPAPPPAPAAVSEPIPNEPVIKPIRKPSRNRRTRVDPRKKVAAPVKPAAPVKKKSAPEVKADAPSQSTGGSSLNVDRLVGSYVSLELKTGRKVMGILEEKTATSYKIQLPGLGPFVYPAENVRSIEPAK